MTIKLLSVSATLILMGANAAFAQGPAKPAYSPIVVEKDGKTFVQKSLPIYLKFSVTPDGQNHTLKSDRPSDANPMYLDTEGKNWIRSKWAVDPATKKTSVPQREVMMPIYADGLPPYTSLSFVDAPQYTSGGTTYFGKGLSIRLRPSDAVSGVAETMYALGAGYQTYTAPVPASKEGAQTFYYFSADEVGNDERVRSTNFTVDLTPPSSSSEFVGIVHNGNILAPSTRIRLTTNDNLSGVRSVKYNFDGGSESTYTAPVRVGVLSDGDHAMAFYGTDRVRNAATAQGVSFYVDKIPPAVSHTIVGDQHRGTYMYVSSRTLINLASSDNKAGVKQVYYRIDGGSRSDYLSDFYIPNDLGVHAVRYNGVDNVENASTSRSFSVYMDNRAPETGIDFGSPQFFHRDTLFITSNTNITLRSRDPHAGVQSTEYALDGGAMRNYTPFTIPTEGIHRINFRATDNVNNVEVDKKSQAFVDNTPPIIFVNFSIEPIGERNNMMIYPNYVRMYIAATDKHTGTDKLMYSIDGAPLVRYSSPKTLDISELSKFKKRKKYEVRIVAEDKLGNRAEEEHVFFVGRQD